MSAHNPKVDDMEADEALLREGAVAKSQLEQKIAEAKKELEKMSTQLERWGLLFRSRGHPREGRTDQHRAHAGLNTHVHYHIKPSTDPIRNPPHGCLRGGSSSYPQAPTWI
jgi:hypothetical protein